MTFALGEVAGFCKAFNGTGRDAYGAGISWVSILQVEGRFMLARKLEGVNSLHYKYIIHGRKENEEALTFGGGSC